jgi:hypothetical protein
VFSLVIFLRKTIWSKLHDLFLGFLPGFLIRVLVASDSSTPVGFASVIFDFGLNPHRGFIVVDGCSTFHRHTDGGLQLTGPSAACRLAVYR